MPRGLMLKTQQSEPFSVENYVTFMKLILLAKYTSKLTTKLTFRYLFYSFRFYGGK